MAAKRIYQIAKEFECEEKKIIEFLTEQGIKVANRLSAVSDDTYKLLKAKLFAPPPPEPEPEPEPKPEPVAEKTAQVAPVVETAPEGEVAPPAPGKKKKKKKKKAPQAEATEGQTEDEENQEDDDEDVPPVNFDAVNAATQKAMAASLVAGNNFLNTYKVSKRKKKESQLHLSRSMDVWGLLQDLKFDDPDSSPIRYWQAVNKLTTKAYRLIQEFGLKNRELMAEIRETFKGLGTEYVPQEIFTDEENQKFAEQQKVLFEAFGHGMGKVNDNLYELKMYAEGQKRYCEHMSFVDYLKNPDSKLERQIPMPFFTLAETVLYSIRSVPMHVFFYLTYKEQILLAVENFFAWIDGYKKLKEQGADPAKIQKYFELEEKLFRLIEFMSYDNLLFINKKKRNIIPFALLLNLLNNYRDNMDDPDAERNFKYKSRGITNLTYKPKEYIFICEFADLEPNKDYRTPEMIAAAEAKKAAAAEATAKVATEAEAAATESEEQENLAEQSDEA